MNYYFKSSRYIISIAAALFALAQPMWAQNDNKVTVPLTDPARPVTLRAHLVSGSITVKGADVKEVSRGSQSDEAAKITRSVGGLKA